IRKSVFRHTITMFLCSPGDPDSCDAPPQVPHAIIVGHDYQKVYPVDSHVTYQCEDGFTSMQSDSATKVFCIAGSWSETPVCIPNSEQPKDPQRWYENGHVIWIRKSVFRHTIKMFLCSPGDPESCGAPPQVPHAIIVGHDYQKVYPVDSHVTYQCEDGFTSMQNNSTTDVFCIAGFWSETPVCMKYRAVTYRNISQRGGIIPDNCISSLRCLEAHSLNRRDESKLEGSTEKVCILNNFYSSFL
uniref:Sushi domain-containing protein n=1 Tax=Cynoglossus semilaevis TaxID=244447 RepID=A0A3P8VJM7_CYNSE